MPTPTKGARLGGGPAHEKHILANLATELFRHGKIKTTEAKARRLRPLAEQLITKAKRGDLHSRRRVLTVVTDKDVVFELFDKIAPRFENRPGGYTRIVKTGPRRGDAAPMAIIELVEALEVAAVTGPSKAAKKAAKQQDKVEALTREEEPAAPSSTTAKDTDGDQDAEAPVSASGDVDADGPGTQAEGDDK